MRTSPLTWNQSRDARSLTDMPALAAAAVTWSRPPSGHSSEADPG